jgi:ketosteroid isomerase-like protein
MGEGIEEAERDLLDALQRGDLSRAAAMLTDDFVITTAGWLADPADKRTWLEGLEEHTLDSFAVRMLAVRKYGDVTVALAESDQQGTRAGVPWQLTFRYTDVWVNHDGVSKLAVRHASVLGSRENVPTRP